jgi:acyl-CoA hydrolase
MTPPTSAPATDKTPLSSVFLVRSEHLNHQGHLFGGDLMAEIDTVAYCRLRRDYPDNSFVTRAATIGFERPATIGDTITFEARIARVGRTSVEVEVTGTTRGGRMCSASMIYVNIDDQGRKTPVHPAGSGG